MPRISSAGPSNANIAEELPLLAEQGKIVIPTILSNAAGTANHPVEWITWKAG